MAWEMTSWIVPLSFWIFLGAVILVPFWLRSRDRQRFYDTVRIAYEKGLPVAPELVAAMQAAVPLPTAERDLRTGVVLLAAGLGMAGLGYGLWWGLMSIDDLSAWASAGWVGGVGAIVALIGLVHLGFWGVRRARG